MYEGRGGGVAREKVQTADHSVRNSGACLFLLSLQLVLLSAQNQVREYVCLSIVYCMPWVLSHSTVAIIKICCININPHNGP